MAKGLKTFSILNDLTGVYNILNALGLITTLVGTPTSTTLVFHSSTLCKDSNTYIRLRLYSVSSSSNNTLAVEFGTVSGTTFTLYKDLIPYSTGADINAHLYHILYDTDSGLVGIFQRGQANVLHGVLFCRLDTTVKLALPMSSNTSQCQGMKSVSTDDTDSYKPILYKNTVTDGQNFLEQDVRVVDASSVLVLNGANPAKIVGLKNVAFSIYDAFISTGEYVLFSGTYSTVASTVEDNLQSFLKLTLT